MNNNIQIFAMTILQLRTFITQIMIILELFVLD